MSLVTQTESPKDRYATGVLRPALMYGLMACMNKILIHGILLIEEVAMWSGDTF